MTQITVGISHVVTGSWYILIPVVAARLRVPAVEEDGARPVAMGRLKLRFPMKIGDMVQKVALARWSRTFSGTIASGVPMLQAIKISGQTAGNEVVAEAMDDVYDSVKTGGSIAKPLEDVRFPPMVSQMVAVGEDSGQLENDAREDRRLLRRRGRRQGQGADLADRAGDDLLVGGVVGFIVISMYLPIFLPLQQHPVTDPQLRLPRGNPPRADSCGTLRKRMKHRLAGKLAVGACALIAGLGASLIVAAPASATRVSSERELRRAWADPTRTRIELGADIALRVCFWEGRSGSRRVR